MWIIVNHGIVSYYLINIFSWREIPELLQFYVLIDDKNR
jgi:hypothetical protein